MRSVLILFGTYYKRDRDRERESITAFGASDWNRVEALITTKRNDNGRRLRKQIEKKNETNLYVQLKNLVISRDF